MILSSFTVIFTSVFQSNIELWIHFFCCSVDKFSCKCEGNVFQKKRLIVTKKKQVLQFHPSKVFQWPENFISNETSFVMMQDLLWTHQNFSFQNTVSFVGQDDKRIFSTRSKILSFFFNGWWNAHPWNRFHGWTLHWRFTQEESVAWTYTTKESFPLPSKLYTVQYTA